MMSLQARMMKAWLELRRLIIEMRRLSPDRRRVSSGLQATDELAEVINRLMMLLNEWGV